LSPEECQTALSAGDETILLDLREGSPNSWVSGATRGFTPGNLQVKADPEMGELSDARMSQRDRALPIITTCERGGTAAVTAGLLKDYGFQNVKIMAGGMTAWEKAGLPLETEYEWGSFSLAGKTAVVTGGASGIGLAISELYTKKGAHTFILDLKLEDAEKAAADIMASTGGQCKGLGCNVANAEEVATAFVSIVESVGACDIVVNNAGVAAVGTVLQCTSDDMDKCYNVNIKGCYHVTKSAVESMTSLGKGGCIINLASIASKFGIRDRFAYAMSKGAVLTMTYSTATDHNAAGIRCNAIAPARIHTPFVEGYLNKSFPDDPQGKAAKFEELSAYQPMGRMGKPRDVAGIALYLASEEAAFCTGQCYSVDGGVENCWDASRPAAL